MEFPSPNGGAALPPPAGFGGGGLDDIDEDEGYTTTVTASTTTTLDHNNQPDTEGMSPISSPSPDDGSTTADILNSATNGIDGAMDIAGLDGDDDDTILGLFSVRKPVDAEAGLSSGLKSAGKGIAAGLGLLVAAPVSGFQKEGAAGLLKGLGVGLAAAVVLPCTGIGVGFVQAARGVANTPEAIKNRTDERLRWDETKREWVEHYYCLDDEFAKLTAEGAKPKAKYANKAAAGPSTAGDAAPRVVKSMELYDALGVPPTATKQEVTRAYYKLALQLHPDRNQGGAQEEAKSRFQRVAAAYEVLGNEASRARYDKDGIANKTAAEMEGDTPERLFCSAEFINALFSSQDLESFTGDLYVATLLEIVGDADGVFDHISGGRVSSAPPGLGGDGPSSNPSDTSSSLPENMKELLEHHSSLRAVRLAQQLRRRMQGWVNAPHMEARLQWLEGFRPYFNDLCNTTVEMGPEEQALYVEVQRIAEEERKNSIGGIFADLKKDIEAKIATATSSSSSPPLSPSDGTTTASSAASAAPGPATAAPPLQTHRIVPNRSKAALIDAVGCAYVSRAREFLGAQDSLSLVGRVERLKSKARNVRTGGKMVVSAVQAFRQFNSAAKKQQAYLKERAKRDNTEQSSSEASNNANPSSADGGASSSTAEKKASAASGASSAAGAGDLPPPPNAEAAFEGGIGGILRACELFNAMDVEKACHEAVGKLLGDMSVAREVRTDLAHGIVHMGLLMQEVAEAVLDAPDEEEALQARMRSVAAASSSPSQQQQQQQPNGIFGRVQQAAMHAQEARTEKKRKQEEAADAQQQQQ